MSKEKDTQQSLAELLVEAKRYFDLQKKYLRYTAAEQVTQVVGKLTVVIVVALVGFVAFIFLGLAFVHWLGATLGSLAVGYALFAALLVAILCAFYINRRRWVFLPLARLMMKAFVDESEKEENND